MKKKFHLIFLLSITVLATVSVYAADKKSSKKAPAETIDTASNEDMKEQEVTELLNAEYLCELGNRLVIYYNETDDRHVALRWKKRIHRLTRIDTTTGADRFENRAEGLIWIGIPTKGMLLDGKKGLQLANECKKVHVHK